MWFLWSHHYPKILHYCYDDDDNNNNNIDHDDSNLDSAEVQKNSTNDWINLIINDPGSQNSIPVGSDVAQLANSCLTHCNSA